MTTKKYFEANRNGFFISGFSVFLVLAMAALEAQEWARAAAYFRQVTEKAPESGFPWFRLGQALHGQGDFTGAIHAMMVAAANRGSGQL